MENNSKIIQLMKECYGMNIKPFEGINSYEKYDKVSPDNYKRISACFGIIPTLLKGVQTSKSYEGAYRVVYENGLGTLQKSAQNPNLYRANIVAPGTNNQITGQALLQKLEPDQEMQVLSMVSSVFTIASVVTKQYYLKSIDDKFASIEKTVNEIKQFLEKDKESQIWADGEFLVETRDMLEFIGENDAYRQSTMATLQMIRRSALSNIKLYYEQLINLKDSLNLKDKEKETNENIGKYSDYLPKLWYSTYIYSVSYSMEAYLSKCTDHLYFETVQQNQQKIIDMFEEVYEAISQKINEYIDTVKALQANEVPSKVLKNVGKVLEVVCVPANPLLMIGAKGVGVLLDHGADVVGNKEKNKKQIKKQDLIDMLESAIAPYSDMEPLKMQMNTVREMDSIYNNRLEFLVDNINDVAYICTEIDMDV